MRGSLKFKVLSVIAGLVLVYSSALAPRPAKAATLAWSSESLPGADNVVVLNAEVVDLAVAADSVTVFAVDGPGQHVYKSTNTGATWTSLAKPSGVGVKITAVAVAPDDQDIVGIIADDNEVYVSTDGGSTWASLGAVQETGQGAAANLYDIALAPASGGITHLAVAGNEGAGAGLGNVWYFNLGAPVITVKETHASPGFSAASGEGVYAIAFSPNFASDKVMLAVSGPSGVADTLAQLQVFSFASLSWNAAAFSGYPVNLGTIGAGRRLTAASIALSGSYSGSEVESRVAFTGFASDDAAAKGRLERLVDTTLAVLLDNTNIRSVAYGSGGRLLAGAEDANIVYRSASPLATPVAIATSSELKRPGGENRVMVGWAGSYAVAGTSGNESAFAQSTDGGESFSDISLIDTSLSTLEDIHVPLDGTTVFLASDDGADLSLWRKDASWKRVFSKRGDTGYILRGAPDENSFLYLARRGGNMLYYSIDAGERRWTMRVVEDNLQDLAVESGMVAYVALSGARAVSKTTNGGFTWGVATDTHLGGGSIHTINSVAAGQLIVGGTTGYVAYSTNGGSSWTAVSQPIETGALLTQVTASSLVEGGYIFAASSLAATKVLRWKIGSSTDWASMGAPVAPGYAAYGVVLYEDTLYVAFSDGVSSTVLRTPDLTASPVNWSALDSPATVFNRAPSALRVSSGSARLWAIDTAGAKLYTYTDIMIATYVKIASPEKESSVPVNAITGRAEDVVFSWARPMEDVSEYQIGIYADEAGSLPLLTSTFTSAGQAPSVVIGPHQSGARFLELQAGASYYWRVRVARTSGATTAYGPWSEMRKINIGPSAALVSRLLSPGNGAAGINPRPAFSWSPLSGVTEYEFQLAVGPREESFALPVAYARTGATAYLVTIPLEYGRTYFWRVRAVAPAIGGWSAVANFTVKEQVAASPRVEVLPPPALPPAEMSLDRLAGKAGTNVTISGSGFGGPVTIKYDGTPVASIAPDTKGGFRATFEVPSSKPGAHTVTAGDGVNSRAVVFNLEATPPAVPVVFSPLAADRVKLPVTFGWQEVAAGSAPVSYTLQVARDEGFSAIVLEKKGLAGPGYVLTEAEGSLSGIIGADAYWRVNAADSLGQSGGWSQAVAFYVTGGDGVKTPLVYAVAVLAGALLFYIGFRLGKKATARYY